MPSDSFESTAQVLAAIFASLGLIVSSTNIYLHLRHYSKPNYQLYIIRILFIVPIYCVLSYASLVSRANAPYYDVIRDFCEYCRRRLSSLLVVASSAFARLLHKSPPSSALVSPRCRFHTRHPLPPLYRTSPHKSTDSHKQTHDTPAPQMRRS
jgi:hypothetical protein